MSPDHSDSETNSIFTFKSTDTAPTEWTEDEGVERSDVMSVLSSLYVAAPHSTTCTFVVVST